MWKCPMCETINNGERCVVCQEPKPAVTAEPRAAIRRPVDMDQEEQYEYRRDDYQISQMSEDYYNENDNYGNDEEFSIMKFMVWMFFVFIILGLMLASCDI